MRKLQLSLTDIAYLILYISIFVRKSESFQFQIRNKAISVKKLSNKVITRYVQNNRYNDPLQMVSRCDEYAIYVKNGKRWGGSVIGPIIRYLNNLTVTLLFKFILTVLNKFKVVTGLNTFLDHVYKRSNVGLLTVSNHQSIQDDPGILASMLPLTGLSPNKLRWVLCTDDVFFYRPWLQSILAGGNVLPLDRSGSLEQPMFEAFKDLLSNGSWCHIFPEGRVFQNWRFESDEPRLGPFKIGVGKLIAHCKRTPIVLPLYHTGMDNVVPEIQNENNKKRSKRAKPKSIFPRWGNQINVFVGDAIDFSSKIKAFNAQNPGLLESWATTTEKLQLYQEITDDLRLAVLRLENIARNYIEKQKSL